MHTPNSWLHTRLKVPSRPPRHHLSAFCFNCFSATSGSVCVLTVLVSHWWQHAGPLVCRNSIFCTAQTCLAQLGPLAAPPASPQTDTRQLQGLGHVLPQQRRSYSSQKHSPHKLNTAMVSRRLRSISLRLYLALWIPPPHFDTFQPLLFFPPLTCSEGKSALDCTKPHGQNYQRDGSLIFPSSVNWGKIYFEGKLFWKMWSVCTNKLHSLL